jgi:hypothetical protein
MCHASTRLVPVLHKELHVPGCSQPVTLILEKEPKLDDVEPVVFDHILLKPVHGRLFEYKTDTPQVKPLTTLPYKYQSKKPPTLPGVRVDPSGLFLWSTALYPKHPLLLFLGWGYASDPGSLLILGFRSGCTPYKVLNLETYHFYGIQNQNRQHLLIGDPTMSQTMAGADGAWLNGKPYANTYDPYWVYLLPQKSGAPATYSLAESRKYNSKHYCWMGQHSNESLAVVYNLPGHKTPVCTTPKQAIKMIPGA